MMLFLAWVAGLLLNGMAFYLLRLAWEPYWPALVACFTTLIPQLGAQCIFNETMFRGATGIQVAVAFLALLISYALGRLETSTQSSLKPLVQLNQLVSGVTVLLALVWLVAAILNALSVFRLNP